MVHSLTRWEDQFPSQEQRDREAALCKHYRGIGISAVAAAQCLKQGRHPRTRQDDNRLVIARFEEQG